MFLLSMGVSLLSLPWATAQVQVTLRPRIVQTLLEEVERDIRRTVYGKPLANTDDASAGHIIGQQFGCQIIYSRPNKARKQL